ncbi:50S ribosomal protein L4 [Patescibacteria group bacterium]|nr:50S ribosomal protein L4 [Patescibacteria group bacterium]MBU4458434.1 50S ribosomal protein L4 [Patescibacteria group bacterium]MCG2695965.1 50S ribosomal protein L4 [Candidatus Portnoybacteria bacterium]
MIKVLVHNSEGEQVGTISLPEEIFGVKINNDLIYQAVNAQTANSRFHLAHAKDRSEVRGGGKKPWRQKGTGRARHGSIRSPLWRGGGVTFGPKLEENFEKKINKKAKRKALFMVLTSKVQDKELIVLDELKIKEPKTKIMAGIFGKILKEVKKPSVLITISKKNENIIIASKNIPSTKTILADSLNVLDLLSFKYLLIDKEAIKVIEKTYGTV